MNCTYCFNNNIPNHYQTGNSLSTECKGLCFHYDLLLKKTIFKSPILSYLPNYPGFWGEGVVTSRTHKTMYATSFHLKWIDVCSQFMSTTVLFTNPLVTLAFNLTWNDSHKCLCTIWEYLDNLEKNHSHTNVKH